MTDREQQEVETLKAQIREVYPGQPLDLSQIQDVELARRAWYFAKSGLKAEYMFRCLKIYQQLKDEGMSVFKRIYYFDDYLKVAPIFIFRDGFERKEVS